MTATSIAKPFPCPPHDCDVSRAATRGVTKNSLFLENGRKTSDGGKVVQQVAERVVTSDEISGLCAASGVIARYSDGLHAQRTGDLFFQHVDTKAVSDGHSKIPGAHDGIFTIFVRRHAVDKAGGVGLGTATKALRVASVSLTHQITAFSHQTCKRLPSERGKCQASQAEGPRFR